MITTAFDSFIRFIEEQIGSLASEIFSTLIREIEFDTVL